MTLDDFINALRTDDINFYDYFKKFLNCKNIYIYATNSGTSAFYLFLQLFTKKGDEVALPSILCPTMLRPILELGRKPVIIDVDPETLNISINDLENKISDKTRVIVPVHLYGLPCEIKELLKISDESGVFVVEDCAHALGAEYKGKKVGTFGHASIFSFNWTKVISCGGGGLLVLKKELS